MKKTGQWKNYAKFDAIILSGQTNDFTDVTDEDVLGIPLKYTLVGARRRIPWFLTLAVWSLFIGLSKSTAI